MLHGRLTRWRASLWLLAVLAALVGLHLAAAVMRIEYDRDYLYGFAAVVDFDREASLPAYFDALLLAMASGLSFVCALAARRCDPGLVWGWAVLGIALLFLSFDEIASIHELMSKLGTGKGSLRGGGWMVLYVPVVAAMGLLYLPFLFRLPVASAVAMIAAGAMFVSGAVLLERVGTQIVESTGGAAITELTNAQWALVRKSWAYTLETTAEETLEMGGLILYIHAVLGYLARRNAIFSLRFGGR